MTSAYHKNIKEGIILFGKKYPKKFIRIHKERLIYIHHPTNPKIKPLIYTPDVYFATKKKGMIIFQVLDSEMKKESLIIADILRAYLSLTVSRAVFVIPSYKYAARIFEVIKIIGDILTKEFGVSPYGLPDISVIHIPKKSSTPEDVKKNLEKIAKKEKW